MNSNQQPPAAEMSGIGYLIVNVRAAQGALPIEDALVRVTRADEQENDVIAATETDRGGSTRRIPLPAPPASESLQPNGKQPYALYNVFITKDGYRPENNVNVPIFSGVTAIQSVNLIPLAAYAPQSGVTAPIIIDESFGEGNL